MARPRNVYRGESRPVWILTLLSSALVAALLLGIWLFYHLQQYVVYDKDGARLVMPSERGEAFSAAPEESGGDVSAAVPRVDVEIVVEKSDYSDVAESAGGELQTLQGRFVSADSVTASALNAYIASMGEYNALVLELKPADGLLRYESAVALAYSYDVNGTLALAEYAERLKDKDIWLVAALSCLADGTMAARNTPAAMKNAETGGRYVRDGQAWLDPYSSVTREYLKSLMAELRQMGFDEILLTGLSLPEDEALRYSGEMTGTPDAESAVSSLALYLRAEADALGLRLSVVVENEALSEAEEAGGQSLALFVKAFDRLAFSAEPYAYAAQLAAAEAALGENADTRAVPIASGFVPNHGSYIIR